MPPRSVPPGLATSPKRFEDYAWVKAPDPMVAILVALFLLLVLAAFIGYRIYRQRQRRKLIEGREVEQIRLTCKSKGLDSQQTGFVIRLAKLIGLEHPARIVESIQTFDRAVWSWIGSLPANRKRRGDPEVQMLSQIRMRLGFLEALGGAYLPSTRELTGGEQLNIKITSRDTGRFYRSSVLDVDEISITIAYVDDGGIPVQVFPGDPLDIRFTRPNDGDYAFVSTVIERRTDLQTPGYTIEHPAVLRRTIKRGDVRIKTKINIRYYRTDMQQMEELRKKEEAQGKWRAPYQDDDSLPAAGSAGEIGQDENVSTEIEAYSFDDETDAQTGDAQALSQVPVAGREQEGKEQEDEGQENAADGKGDTGVGSETSLRVKSGEAQPGKYPSVPTGTASQWAGVRSARKSRGRRRRRGEGGEEAFTRENLDGIELYDTTISNLSRGGAQIVSDKFIPIGEFVRFDPNYRGEFPVGGLTAQVLRTEAVSEGVHRYNLKFVRVPPSAGERLGRKVLEKNREEVAKRMDRG